MYHQSHKKKHKMVQSQIVQITETEWIEKYENSFGRPCAKYIKQTTKARFNYAKILYNYRFSSDQDRMKWIQSIIDQKEKSIESKNKSRQDRLTRNASRVAEVGQIFVYSYGYDQTNIEFYQVTKVSGRKVTLREICQSVSESAWCSGTCLPVKDSFCEHGDEIQKISAVDYNGKLYVTMRCGRCTEWDGSAKYWSSYH